MLPTLRVMTNKLRTSCVQCDCAESLVISGHSRPRRRLLPDHGTHLSCGLQQLPPDQVQIREREQRGQLDRVLGQAAVTHRGESELSFHDPKRMFDSGPQLRQPMIDLALPLGQVLARTPNPQPTPWSRCPPTRSMHVARPVSVPSYSWSGLFSFQG